ncbi:serine/threonine-protein kinase [Microbacterium sp. HJ5]
MSTPSSLVAERYRLVKMLGAGGMGVVWQAWDERLHRAVALKMLRTQPELSESDERRATERALREARITAGLRHPHAVTVFDVIQHEGRPCIVMELLDSTPLSELLAEHGSLTPLETARIAAQASSALAAAHKLRIVHRDVKPGNILITADGSAMISDFGISHALGDATITATGLIHGTPAYLAPEVARGQPTTFASDVFSLGSTMYTMLEGHPPFGTDKNAISLLHKVARGGHPPPKSAGVLAPLLQQMLSANPKRRPSMAAVAKSLSALEHAGSGPPDGVATLISMMESEERADAARGAADSAPTVPITDATTQHASPSAATPSTISLPASLPTIRQRDAPTARTLPADQPTRYEPPTAETERLRPARSDAEVPSRGGRGRRAAVVAGVLILVAALVIGAGALLSWWSPTGNEAADPSESPAPPATSATQSSGGPSTSPSSSASPSVGATPAPSREPGPVPPTPEQRAAGMISGYYAALPGDLDAAWPQMTADYQENHAGGRGGYEAFWSQVAAVELSDVSASGLNRAQATLTYRFHDGRVVDEVTSFDLVDDGGLLKIAATTVLSSSQR